MGLDVGHATHHRIAHPSKIVQFFTCAFLEVASILVFFFKSALDLQIRISPKKQTIKKFLIDWVSYPTNLCLLPELSNKAVGIGARSYDRTSLKFTSLELACNPITCENIN